MTGIKTAESHGTLREGGEREYTANKIQREVSDGTRRSARSEIPCPPSIRSCLLMFDKGGYLSWESKFAYCYKLNSGSASPYTQYLL